VSSANIRTVRKSCRLTWI